MIISVSALNCHSKLANEFYKLKYVMNLWMKENNVLQIHQKNATLFPSYFINIGLRRKVCSIERQLPIIIFIKTTYYSKGPFSSSPGYIYVQKIIKSYFIRCQEVLGYCLGILKSIVFFYIYKRYWVIANGC